MEEESAEGKVNAIRTQEPIGCSFNTVASSSNKAAKVLIAAANVVTEEVSGLESLPSSRSPSDAHAQGQSRSRYLSDRHFPWQVALPVSA